MHKVTDEITVAVYPEPQFYHGCFKGRERIEVRVKIYHKTYGNFSAHLLIPNTKFTMKEYKKMTCNGGSEPSNEFMELVKNAVKRTQHQLVRYSINYQREIYKEIR